MIEIRLSSAAYHEVHEQLRRQGLSGYADNGFVMAEGIKFIHEGYEERARANEAAFARCEAAYLEAPE